MKKSVIKHVPVQYMQYTCNLSVSSCFFLYASLNVSINNSNKLTRQGG